MDTYPDSEAKVWLAIESAKVAKIVSVQEEGIGEDLTFNLLVWRDDQLSAICQLDTTLMDEPAAVRLSRTTEAAILCRTGFEASSMTLVAEGYCALDPADIDMTIPLSDQFLTNTKVRECLTITHLGPEGVEMVALPYTYDVPRRVRWETPVAYPSKETNNPFLLRLLDILSVPVPPAPVDDETWREITAHSLHEQGFHVEHSLDLLD